MEVEDFKQKTFSLLTSINQICHQNPQLYPLACERLNLIFQRFSQNNYNQQQVFHQNAYIQPPPPPRQPNTIESNMTYERFRDLMNSCSQDVLSQMILHINENPLFLDYFKRYLEESNAQTPDIPSIDDIPSLSEK